MRILALCDQVVEHVYGPQVREHYPGVDLILGAGDLPPFYLEYVECQYNVPMLYVPGNHDPDRYAVPGGEDVDGRAMRVRDRLVVGFGGSRRYKRDGAHQYTEAEMHLRLAPLLPRLLLRRLRLGHGMDILLTHAPPRGIHDADDLAHTGFQAFRRLIHLARPRLVVHGHVHLWAGQGRRETTLDGTRILNAYPVRLIELEPGA